MGVSAGQGDEEMLQEVRRGVIGMVRLCALLHARPPGTAVAAAAPASSSTAPLLLSRAASPHSDNSLCLPDRPTSGFPCSSHSTSSC